MNEPDVVYFSFQFTIYCFRNINRWYMNKTIPGIGLKRIGLILISVSLILFCYWCWQLHVLLWTAVKNV